MASCKKCNNKMGFFEGIKAKSSGGICNDCLVSPPVNTLDNKNENIRSAPKNSKTDDLISSELIQDITYIANNMHQFYLGQDCPYVMYWLRCSSNQPQDEYLYNDETPMSPIVDIDLDESWKPIILKKPEFSDPNREEIAYSLMIKELEEFISENASRLSVHPDDTFVLELCKRVHRAFFRARLSDLIIKSKVSFRDIVQKIIFESYIKERDFLELLLEEKQTYLRPMISKALSKSIDEFGEERSQEINDAVFKILDGIRLSEKYKEQFKLFVLPQHNMGFFAKHYMLSWFDKDSAPLDLPQDGLEFEAWVAQKFKDCGWIARATQGSGDQGIDVIAHKDDISIGVQCKLYTGSVGNGAIQEAFAGMKHFGLDHAAVITNSSYTKSAKELANSTGVMLLGPDDISTLRDKLHL